MKTQNRKAVRGAAALRAAAVSVGALAVMANTATAEIPQLLDELQKTFSSFKSENDKRLAEIEKTGKESATTRQNVENLDKRLNEIQAAITKRNDELEAKLNRIDLGSGGGEDVAKEAKGAAAFSRMLRNGASVDVKQYREYCAAWNQYVRRGDAVGGDIRNALQVGTDPDGGYLTPPDTSGRIVKKIYDTSPIRQIANVVTISSDALEGLIDNGEAGSGWVGETESRTDTPTPQLGKWRIDANEQYAEPRATQQLLDDGAFDVEGWLAMKVADRFARQENAAFVAGNGIRKPKGFTAYTTAATADSSRAWGVLEHVVSGANGAFAGSNPSDAIISLIYTLKQAYRQNARFVTNKSVLSAVRKFKGSDNNYLWQPALVAGQPSQLMGYPVMEAEDMPALATNSLSLAFGDFNEGYQIVDRIGIRVLRDPFTAKPYVKFYTTKRTGGGVVNFEAIKVMKFST